MHKLEKKKKGKTFPQKRGVQISNAPVVHSLWSRLWGLSSELRIQCTCHKIE